MSDLPPFLSHATYRNMAWTGHATFPFGSFRHRNKLKAKWPNSRKFELRIFERHFGPAGVEYILMSEDSIKEYLDSPDVD